MGGCTLDRGAGDCGGAGGVYRGESRDMGVLGPGGESGVGNRTPDMTCQGDIRSLPQLKCTGAPLTGFYINEIPRGVTRKGSADKTCCRPRIVMLVLLRKY